MAGSISMVMSALNGERIDHVADAFRRRKWLVVLTFAQHTFTVAIDSAEAQTGEDAIRLAYKRSDNFNWYERLGNLMDSQVVPDTPETRALLKVDGSAMEPIKRVPKQRHFYDAA